MADGTHRPLPKPLPDRARIGELQLFKDDGGLSFNRYSVFMTTFTPIKIVSYLLYATILLHAINGFYLVARNQKARPVKYEGKKDTRGSSWASRNMGILGTILLIFIVTHMINFWYEYKFGSMDWKTYIVDATTSEAGNCTGCRRCCTTPQAYRKGLHGQRSNHLQGSLCSGCQGV